MNKERLEDLRKLRNEVESLAGGLITYVPKAVADTVKGSTAERPWQHRTTVEGLDLRECNALEKKLAKKTKSLTREIADLENWLDEIKDPILRTAFRMHYGKGKTWEVIGEAVGYDRTTISDKCKRYLAEIERENI